MKRSKIIVEGETIMKSKIQIVSFIIALLLVIKCMPFTYATNGDTLTINGTIYDAITDVEYGWDGTEYRFADGILDGVEDGHEVYLVADATTNGSLTVDSNVNVELFNFRLEGVDAANYIVPLISDSMPIRKQIQITKKIIKIMPEHSYIYFGQSKPDQNQITEVSNYQDQIINHDDINITATFEIENGDYTAVGDYAVSMQGQPNISGDDADHYEVILDPKAKFSILAYEPNQMAASNEVPDGNYAGVTQAVLHAPNGFWISLDNDPNHDWSDSITIPLTETQNGFYTYYLRNSDSSDTEYYNAISEPKTYCYTSVQTKPTVKSMKIEQDNTATILNFLTFGVFGNGKVTVTVYVEGAEVAQDTTIYLGEDGDYESKIVSAADAMLVDGKYTYTATFDFDVNIGESITKNLKAYAVNSSGEGDQYPANGTNDTFVGAETKADKPLTIDKKEPDVEITKIDGNYQNRAIKADFTISDSGSGIAKVEYLWDDGFLLNEGDLEYQTNYVEFTDYASDQLHYELILPWNLSKSVPHSRHTLYLRVTDHAGNVTICAKNDEIGSDMLPPNIESIEIRKPISDESEDILNFFDFGTFYNNVVKIVIKANDNEADEDYYASGVKTVQVNGRIAVKNEENNEYILVVSADDYIENMRIMVEDEIGFTTETLATEVSEHGSIKSNDLMVEDTSPTIDFGNIEDQGHRDNEGNVWFGIGDNNLEMNITVTDVLGSVQSGLCSVTIKDNGQMQYSNSNFPFKTTEHTETFIIGNLSDGEHIFTVEVSDNCGNTFSDSITFYKDTVPPEHGLITAIAPECVTIDDKQWFEKNEIITFRVDASDAASGLKSILLQINGKVYHYDYGDIQFDGAGYYVLADTIGIETDSEHKYTVMGTVTDFANNALTLTPLTVYRDFEKPTIEKFTVQKKTDAIDKVLNVLTFGVYSNDTLIFKAYTKDIEFDSGIHYATVEYAGLSTPKEMTDEGDDVFSVEIPVSDTVFESNIIIHVYDKYGKESVSCPNITNVEGDAVSIDKFVMIETVLPTMTLSLPAGDSITRTDGQVWYNSNKEVALKVQDGNSGINNIDLFVNGVEILKDKNDVNLLKTVVTESADSRNNDEQNYIFDTDYFTSICGEAEDGKYVITVQVTDNAGNVRSDERTYYVDKVPPSIDRIDFIPKTSDGIESTEQFIEKLEYGYYFKTDFDIIVNVSDVMPSSGLYEVKYRFVPYQDGQQQAEINGTQSIVDGKVTLNVPKGFKGQIFVEAFDYVLNRSGEKTTKAYIVDNSAPDIQITKNVNSDYYDAAGNNLYVETNSFTVVITDTVSGIKQIGYLQNAEQNPYERKTIDIDHEGYNLNDHLGDGWIVTGVDVNLVTQVTKIFTFPNDDNDVILTFDATDNSQNKTGSVKSEKFTVDKTAPIINVVFRDDDDTDAYYNHNRVADITVIERNFDENLIKVAIVNTFGNVPIYSFTENSKTEHTAVIDFDEGDYTFQLTGTDLGNHTAIVHFSGGNENLFYVDKTKPVIEENFAEFSNSAENSFKVDKTANIKITERNFDPELVNLKITSKEAGAGHDADELEDVTSEILGVAKWNSTGDVHTISFTLDRDAVYYVEVTPVDLATNIADKHSTAIFEIDKTIPVVSMKNGLWVDEDDTEFLDVYPYVRKDDDAPTVEFEDLNISHIKYKLSVYIPDYSTSDDVVVRSVATSGTVEGNKYTLPDFTKDGVYAIELIAVDVAGNESALNLNTYARMINQDVLAFIMESNLQEKTGLYSIEYENGEAISKKPSSFDDLKIFILAKKDTPIDIVLRDGNGKEILTNAQCTMDDSIYGMGIYNYLLKSDFFQENFQDDIDVEMYLTVKNQGYRIDLGKIHIDNIAPTCDMPNDLTSWQWFNGEIDRTFVLSNISELIDESRCKIYDNGEAIPFVYSSDDHTITFTLSKGWHNVGVILDDMAGNANNIQEKINIHIGYFWLWVIVALSVAVITAAICIVIYNRNRKKRSLEEI